MIGLKGFKSPSRSRARQAPDWHEPASAQRDALGALLDSFAATPAAALLPLEQLRGMIGAWSDAEWTRGSMSRDYRTRLLRALSLGHFLRQAPEGAPAGGARPGSVLDSERQLQQGPP
jgi:hypothetical protein